MMRHDCCTSGFRVEGARICLVLVLILILNGEDGRGLGEKGFSI